MNHDLARVAGQHRLAFSVGSQRILLTQPEMLPDFAVRESLPDGVLLGNIGAPQLPQVPTARLAELAQMIEADGICVHLNVGQEICQPEGDRAFRGQLDGIARLVQAMDGRVLVKETGAGMAPATLELLRSVGVQYVDVAGSGGTSWTKVEAYRWEGDGGGVAQTFADWGVPTAVSILAARKLLGEQATVVGSGGIRDGLDAARALACGADVAGFAYPAMMAWSRGGTEGADRYLQRITDELRAAMLLCGCADLAALRRVPRVIVGQLQSWRQQLEL
jgi:isopentenyl-diphosphate delta-isomerase